MKNPERKIEIRSDDVYPEIVTFDSGFGEIVEAKKYDPKMDAVDLRNDCKMLIGCNGYYVGMSRQEWLDFVMLVELKIFGARSPGIQIVEIPQPEAGAEGGEA